MTTKPDLTRVWASGAPGGNVEDPDVTTPGKFAAGWVAEIPPFENFNFLQQLFTQGLAHANEFGIMQWDTDTEYPIGGWARSTVDNQVYVSLVATNQGNEPSASPTQWILLKDELQVFGKNLLINAKFDVWQRGTSIGDGIAILNEEYLADRWLCNDGVGGAMIISRESLGTGEKIGKFSPNFFHRINFPTTAATSGSKVEQRIENVRVVDDETIAISFYAKGTMGGNISVDIRQNFGTGGSPSSDVTTNVDTFALTGSWVKHEFTVNVPSISGKTGGSNNDDYLSLEFNLPGSELGTFDLALPQVEVGPKATDFEDRQLSSELQLCQRYYQELTYGETAHWSANFSRRLVHVYMTEMRDSPSGTIVPSTGAGLTVNQIDNTRVELQYVTGGSGTFIYRGSIELDAEL
jgi:hypothetical protein